MDAAGELVEVELNLAFTFICEEVVSRFWAGYWGSFLGRGAGGRAVSGLTVSSAVDYRDPSLAESDGNGG